MERIFKIFWILTLICIPLSIFTKTFEYMGIITATMALCIIIFETIKYKLTKN